MRKISEKLIKYDKYKICKFEDGNFFLATNDDVERIITACNDVISGLFFLRISSKIITEMCIHKIVVKYLCIH